MVTGLLMTAIHISTHDIGNAANFRCLPKYVHHSFPLTKAFAKSLKCQLRSDLRSELETVRNGFRRGINLHLSPLHQMPHHAEV